VTATAVPPTGLNRPRGGWRRVKRVVKAAGVTFLALAVAVTAASFGYNLATNGPAPRPAHLLFAEGGGWDTRYLEWGTHGTPVILVPGAFETADTFAKLGPALANDHRVFAIDLSGTGYSAPNPPFSAGHLAGQVLAFAKTMKLTGASTPVLVGHSAGAADVVVAGADDPQFSHSDEALTARRIGAPPPVFVPGRHLTMIASPGPVAAAIDSLGNRHTSGP
jgi:pimeloyl-ACP methyl ester carboxylesterase